jgi:hypothetical protein
VTQSDNISLASMYAKWFGDGTTAFYATAVTSLLLLTVAGAAIRTRRNAPPQAGLEGGLLLMLTPLLSPQGWDFVLVVSTLAIAWLVNDFDRLPRTLRPLTAVAIAIIGLTLYDLLGRWLLYALLNGGAITVAVLVVVSALIALRPRHAA